MSDTIPACRVPARRTRLPTARNLRRPCSAGRCERVRWTARLATCWQRLRAASIVHMTADRHLGWIQTSQIGLIAIPGRCSR